MIKPKIEPSILVSLTKNNTLISHNFQITTCPNGRGEGRTLKEAPGMQDLGAHEKNQQEEAQTMRT